MVTALSHGQSCGPRKLRPALAYAANVWHGMEIAAAEGDRVFSYSWHTADFRPDQGGSCSEAVEQFWQAWEDNTVELRETYPDLLIIIAGGNAAENYCHKYSAMIMVGGTMLNGNDEVVYDLGSGQHTSEGEWIGAMAPAVSILTTQKAYFGVGCASEDYCGVTRTSFAAPQVAGLANLIWCMDNEFTADQVEGFILDGCEPFTGYDPDLHGRGRINAFNSLAMASGDLWTRTPNPGVADDDNVLKAAGAQSGSTIKFYFGTSTGLTAVSGCSLNVDIANATLLGSATAGANGSVTIAVSVPSTWAGQTVYLQVVEIGSPCRKSNLVTFLFPAL